MVNIDLRLGNCLDILKELPENNIDCVVTDPPYELGFMGKHWDSTGIAYNPALWKEVLRVLKPGGHLLSFGGSRTYHRMACAIEDAGFEIRDQIMWVYGSGFPKSLNIGKAVDKMRGNKREEYNPGGRYNYSFQEGNSQFVSETATHSGKRMSILPTKGTSEWEGWGTALKPAHEPIVLARKPLSEKTVAENVLKWGVGGINIDGCRVETKDNLNGGMYSGEGLAKTVADHKWGFQKRDGQYKQPLGRFPANFIHDGSQEVLELFPNTKAGIAVRHNSGGNTFGGNNPKPPMDDIGYSDAGSAARFFYCAKASKSERDRGCEGLEDIKGGSYEFRQDGSLDGKIPSHKNNHPTVKPLALMKYLIKLVSREGQTVLDPFMGSGTTGIAAKELNRSFVGIEMNSEYMEIAKRRINA